MMKKLFSDLDAKNSEGRTALEIAQINRQIKISGFIKRKLLPDDQQSKKKTTETYSFFKESDKPKTKIHESDPNSDTPEI